MISASAELKRLLAENTKTLFKATLTFTDGTTIELTGDDVSMGSMTISDAVSSGSSFDVGAAIIGKCTVTLNNYDRRFDSYDFSDAELVPFVGVEKSNGTEWLCMGRYYVEQPDAYGSTIGLTAFDKMRDFEKSYADVQTVYPASLGDIVGRICTHCGVQLENQGFANSTYVINKRPDDSLSCLSVLAYVAQISGNWARVTKNGLLRLDWYDRDAFSSGSDLDGGTFLTETTPYSDGDAADGGEFMYGGGSYDGGTFSNIKYTVLSAHSSLTVNTDDVLITGVRITSADNEDGTTHENVKTALYGVEGYVLEIADNQLIEYGKASTVAAQIGARVVGMRFRPFQSSAIGLPYVEAGDAVVVVDERGNEYESYLTSIVYKQGGYESFSCGAESAGRNRANTQSAEVKAFIAAKHAFKREKTAREVALETLAFMLASASGLYKTEDVQSDGSTVYYMHDQPTLAQSTTIWKATANAFGVSNDGGQTYSYGVSSNGVAILNRIYAVGIDADYIDTGVLTVRDRLDSTKILFKADISTGIVNIGGFNVSNTTIYNDVMNLGNVGLEFVDDSQTIGAIYPMHRVSSGNLLGLLRLVVPDALQVYSTLPYIGSSSNKALLLLDRTAKSLQLLSGFSGNDALDVVAGSKWSFENMVSFESMAKFTTSSNVADNVVKIDEGVVYNNQRGQTSGGAITKDSYGFVLDKSGLLFASNSSDPDRRCIKVTSDGIFASWGNGSDASDTSIKFTNYWTGESENQRHMTITANNGIAIHTERIFIKDTSSQTGYRASSGTVKVYTDVTWNSSTGLVSHTSWKNLTFVHGLLVTDLS